ncbi:hypothetical protein [Acinetobacter baumannii]|nr:hypothetical protein [Acinetobacter baumannii]
MRCRRQELHVHCQCDTNASYNHGILDVLGIQQCIQIHPDTLLRFLGYCDHGASLAVAGASIHIVWGLSYCFTNALLP